MRVMIIGGTSFIGPALVRRLVDLGNSVAVFRRGQTRAELPPSVEHILGDRRNLEQHATEIRRFGPEVVVDMIAFTEADAIGLVEAFRGLARRTVVISSADVYRAYGRFIGVEPGPVDSTPLGEGAALRTALFPYRRQAKGPDDFNYSYDKIPVERIASGDPNLPGTVLRLPMVHGLGDLYHRLSSYVKRMDDYRPAILVDEGLARWKCPRGYVENVAAAIALAVVDDRAMGGVFNVADPVAFTEAEWIRMIGEVVGWRGKVVNVPDGRIPVPYHIEQNLDTDSDRIRQVLGYQEVVGPRDALERTIAWERANPAGPTLGMGTMDYDAEDALLAELGDSLG
jgi:nucleoside-diphosphate-sugar epimerase